MNLVNETDTRTTMEPGQMTPASPGTRRAPQISNLASRVRRATRPRSTSAILSSCLFGPRVFTATLVCLGFGGLCSHAEISEPDTIFYGRIINRTSHQEYLVTQGTLSWTIRRPDGKQIIATAQLTPLNGGLYSYRLAVPQEALAYGLTASADVVPLTSQTGTCSHVGITLDGNAASILAPGGNTFTVSQALRASTYRLDLEVFNPLPDAAGDGIPDWWKAQYGVVDPNADPDHDGWNNLQEFLHASNPNSDNRLPSLATREALVFGSGTTGLRLQAVDSDSAATNLFFTLLRTPQTGTLYLRNAKANPAQSDLGLVSGSVFTQDDVNRGRVVFVHPGGDAATVSDSLTVSLRDETPSHPAVTNVVALNIYAPSSTDSGLQQAQAVAAAPAAFNDIPGISFSAQQLLLNYVLSRDHGYVIWDDSRAAAPQELKVPSSGLTAAEYALYVANYGHDRPQLLVAGAGGDHLVGGMENDILVAGSGGESLRGNGGADLFVIPGVTRGHATIEDFNVGENDVIDLSRVLVGSSTALANYVQVTQAGGSTYLGISANGDGVNYSDLVLTLSGAQFTQADLRTLVDKGNLVTGNKVLPAQVSIAATSPRASQNGPVSGLFTLTRSGTVNAALTAYLQITGSAVNGSDYEYLSSQVNFAAGQRTLTLSINPYVTSTVFTQVVQVAVSAGTGYEVGSASVAQVTIAPMLPQVSIQAIAPVASRLEQAAGVFLVTRGGVINNSVLVTLSISGTAPSAHYSTVPSFLNFAPQQTTALISVTPRSGVVLSQGPESVQVTIQPSASYLIGHPASDRILLVDQFTTFALWQQQHFPGSTEAAAAFAAEDTGHTGVRNVFRYAFGLDPFAPQDPARFPNCQVIDDHVALSFKRPPAISDVTYLIEVSDDLVNWRSAGADVEPYLPPAGTDFDTVCVRSTSAVSQTQKQFLRVRVALQP